MSLTPFTSARRSRTPLYFNGPFAQVTNPSGDTTAVSYLNVHATSGPLYDLGMFDVGSAYNAAFFTPTATIIGLYNPSDQDPISTEACYGAIKADLSQIATSDGHTIYRTLTLSAPTAYSLGPLSGTGSLNLPSGYVNNLVSPSLSYEYTTGLGILCSNATPVIALRDLAGTTNYGAFYPNNPATDPSYYRYLTLNSGGYNYTLVDENGMGAYSSSDVVWFSKWQPTTLGGFSGTNYSISLDDPTDDAFLQAAFVSHATDASAVRCHTSGNGKHLIIVNGDSFGDYTHTQTVFVFDADFANYDRLDITVTQSLFVSGLYYQDSAGVHWFTGTDSEVFYYQIGEDDGPVVGSVEQHGWGFSLDGHDFYVLKLGTSSTLVFDRMTRQWSEWSSPGLTYLRVSCGTNWQGMGTTLADGGTDVVVGDDTLGVLYRLDPTHGRDDAPTSGDAAFTRIVTGSIPVDGRASVPCDAVQITLSLGNPSQLGAAFTLEISDDLGQNWTDCGTVTTEAGNYSEVVEWRALGQMRQPGRLFRFSDDGAAVRIGRAQLR